MRTIIPIRNNVIDLGEYFITPKIIVTYFLVDKSSKSKEYTFTWMNGLVKGIKNIPVPLNPGLRDLKGVEEIKEFRLINRRLLLCQDGTLLYRATLDKKDDVVIKYACDRSTANLLILETAVSLKLPKHKSISDYRGVTSDSGLVSLYFDGEILNVKKANKRVRDQCWEALDFLHASDIVHGDVRHQNILVKGDDVRIIDFSTAYKKGWAGITSLGLPNYSTPTKDKDRRDMEEVLKVRWYHRMF